MKRRSHNDNTSLDLEEIFPDGREWEERERLNIRLAKDLKLDGRKGELKYWGQAIAGGVGTDNYFWSENVKTEVVEAFCLLESWLQSKTLPFPLLGLVPVLSLLSIF